MLNGRKRHSAITKELDKSEAERVDSQGSNEKGLTKMGSYVSLVSSKRFSPRLNKDDTTRPISFVGE